LNHDLANTFFGGKVSEFKCISYLLIKKEESADRLPSQPMP